MRFGGLEIPLFYNGANYEYENSRKFTLSLINPVSESLLLNLFSQQSERKLNQNKQK